MLSLFKGFRKIAPITVVLASCGVAQFFSLTPIIGSARSWFLLSDALSPLAGLGGIVGAFLFSAFKAGLSPLILSAPLVALVYHIPGFCAAASWAYPNALMRVVLPLGCMILFIIHPQGSGAALYACYWFIPVALFFTKKRSIFLQALSATFIAHAVGSVVWLYGKQLPTAVWLGLIPVVIFERILNAAVMTAVYYGVAELVAVYQSRKRHRVCS